MPNLRNICSYDYACLHMLHSWWSFACCFDVSLKILLIVTTPSVNCCSCKSCRFLQLTHKYVVFYMCRRQRRAATGINYATCHFGGGFDSFHSYSAISWLSKQVEQRQCFWGIFLLTSCWFCCYCKFKERKYSSLVLSASLWRDFQLPPTCSWAVDLMGYCAGSVCILPTFRESTFSVNVSNEWTINAVQHSRTLKTSTASVLAAISLQRGCCKLPAPP